MHERDGRAIRVLVTGGEHTASLAAVRGLRAAGYRPWVGATSRRSYAGRSRAAEGTVVLPYSGADPGGFIARLQFEVARLGIGVVIPGTEPDLVAITDSSDTSLRAIAGLPQPKVVQRIVDKTEVYRAARSAGLRVPRTELIGRDALAAVSDADFPAIIKPVRSARQADSGALIRIDAQLVGSRAELGRVLAELGWDHWLIQARLDGQLGAISGVAREGELVTAVHQRSRRVWPPGAGVSSFAETVPPDPVLEGNVARLIGALSWNGIFQAQFIHNDLGAHLIDLNPRIYGSLALATAAGVNLPAIWAALVSGSSVEPAPYRVGVRYRSDELDIRSLLHLAAHGRPAAAISGMVPRPRTAHSVLALSDPAPGLTSLAKLARYVLRRGDRD
jgi:predicted ATP-grasp superfamily ATP-dependent carboligase